MIVLEINAQVFTTTELHDRHFLDSKMFLLKQKVSLFLSNHPSVSCTTHLLQRLYQLVFVSCLSKLRFGILLIWFSIDIQMVYNSEKKTNQVNKDIVLKHRILLGKKKRFVNSFINCVVSRLKDKKAVCKIESWKTD